MLDVCKTSWLDVSEALYDPYMTLTTFMAESGAARYHVQTVCIPD